MANFSNTIGIDVSKDKIDVHDYKSNKHHIFKNNPEEHKKFLDWVKEKCNQDLTGILFCFENTGIYSLALSCFMEENKLAYSVVAGLEIKRSIGLTRGKNDQIDACKIAEYAYLRRETIKLSQIPSKALLKLKELLTIREKMVKHRVAYQSHLKSLANFYERRDAALLFESQEKVVGALNQQIKTVEKEMKNLIEEADSIKQNYELATSVKGIGLILGLTILVYSDNFSKFKTWRQFASYVGIGPFDYESGSSIKRGKKVSNLANKRIKGLLSNAVAVNIQDSGEMRIYYQKRVEEGKNKNLVKNIISNKVVARVFAVVKRGTPYVDIVSYAA